MNSYKKIKIIEKMDRRKFFEKIFCVWADKKRKLPSKLVCFWCLVIIEPASYFQNGKLFVTTRGGEVFESPTKGHKFFNNLYQDTFNVEMCEPCFNNLDMYNKTGLWFQETGALIE